MSNIKQLLSNANIWNHLPTQLNNYIRENYGRAIDDQYNSPSPVLNRVLRETIGNHCIVGKNAYHTLAGICTLLLDNKPIQFIPRYRTISSTEAETLTLNDIQSELHYNNANIHINIYLIPRGKTYLKNLLESNTTYERIRPIETFCIEDTSHFIRIYKGMVDTVQDITIFTDRVTEHLIHTILVMLPNLFDLNERPVGEIIPEEDKLYNERVKIVREIFTLLYEVYRNNIQHDDENMIATLIAKLAEFSTKFQWNNTQLNNFATNLANVRNEYKTRDIQQNLDRVARDIKDYENTLIRYYTEQHELHRELMAFKTLGPDDVKSFTDTICNTKAIEILNATSTRLKLRITAPLQFFTSADFESYERNIYSSYHRQYDSTPIIKDIMHKIFVTREYKILLQAIIHIAIQSSTNPLYIYAQHEPFDEFDQFPNPHLYHFDCWGKAKTEIQRLINANDFELAVMQMIAAVQSVNVAEPQSFINTMLPHMNEKRYSDLITIIDEYGNEHTWTEMQKIELDKQLKTANSTENERKTYTQVVIDEENVTDSENTTVNDNNDDDNGELGF